MGTPERKRFAGGVKIPAWVQGAIAFLIAETVTGLLLLHHFGML